MSHIPGLAVILTEISDLEMQTRIVGVLGVESWLQVIEMARKGSIDTISREKREGVRKLINLRKEDNEPYNKNESLGNGVEVPPLLRHLPQIKLVKNLLDKTNWERLSDSGSESHILLVPELGKVYKVFHHQGLPQEIAAAIAYDKRKVIAKVGEEKYKEWEEKGAFSNLYAHKVTMLVGSDPYAQENLTQSIAGTIVAAQYLPEIVDPPLELIIYDGRVVGFSMNYYGEGWRSTSVKLLSSFIDDHGTPKLKESAGRIDYIHNLIGIDVVGLNAMVNEAEKQIKLIDFQVKGHYSHIRDFDLGNLPETLEDLMSLLNDYSN